MTVFKKEEMKNNLKLCILNELLARYDIKDLKTLKKVAIALKDIDLKNLYYYELYDESEPLYSPINYISNLEFELVDILNIGLPIGYSIDIIYCILDNSHKYGTNALNNLNDMALLELFNIGLFNQGINDLLKFLSSYLSDMAFKYLKLSLESYIPINDKLNFLIGVIDLILSDKNE